ncbi:mechanosensitive ion channel family protein [Algoriphagus sp. CAU 1675]|uniref:mechanosensitive ion channel family protein n=1 Tax=Algoriphagus sp. CAU 1675 TaxID=3032597 RepID=UPI0023DA1FC3|nr:mechanosensitive ion channel family protein [Algoriphagus sp. CAU 1675]MDF2159164.1 mechanosensitive ion channel family protein [Algoriphagus sp. CAU 1675]
MISEQIGAFSPADRAQIFSSKLNQLLEKNEFDTTSLKIKKSDHGYEIFHSELALGSVTLEDAIAAEKGELELASEYLKAIKSAYAQKNEQRTFTQQLTRTGILIGVFVLVIILVRLINNGLNKLIDYSLSRWHRFFHGISIKNFELLSAEKEERLLKSLFNFVKVLIIIILLYLALPIMFSIFPSTKGIAHTLLGYITNPVKSILNSFFGYIPELFMILIVVTITYYVREFINFICVEIEQENLHIPGFYPDWARPTFNLLKVILYAFSFIVIFPYLPGSDSPAFQGVSVFLGLLISLGSSSAISNIIAGLVIIYMRAFKLGDRVTIGDTTGDVVEKTMLVTRVRTIKNEEVTIPNSAILNGKTINYSVEANGPGLILHSTVTIGYDIPWRQVHELLIKAASKVNLLLKEPKPYVLQTSLDDFYVSYQINAYTKNPEKASLIYSELHAAIQDAFNEAGVEIMSPHYRAERDGNQITIPPTYLPKG